MTRSLWKYPYTAPKLEQLVQQKVKVLKTYERSATITSPLIGTIIRVHNGNRFVPISVSQSHVGFKLGQFVLTKKRVRHKKKIPKARISKINKKK
jgi:small subunit ribosomal protein S19